MGAPASRYHHTMADYLAIEESSAIRHEFSNGEVVAVAGGTPEHAALSAAVVTLLGTEPRGKPCRVYSADLRLRVTETGLATYADASVVRGDPELDPESPTHVTNPTLVVEILSPSTEAYDRGEKRQQYQRMASFRDYVIVGHDRARIDHWRRTEDGWVYDTLGDADVLELPSIGCSIHIGELYEMAGMRFGDQRA
jgi:Uma2 family endonuclease